MSLENAKKFTEMVSNDKSLKERLAAMQQEEILAYAKEQGLEFTLEEMKELAKSRDLAPDEMEQAAGGKKTGHREGPPCPCNPNGVGHKWKQVGTFDDPILLILKQTSMFYVCEYCSKSSRDTSLEINW